MTKPEDFSCNYLVMRGVSQIKVKYCRLMLAVYIQFKKQIKNTAEKDKLK